MSYGALAGKFTESSFTEHFFDEIRDRPEPRAYRKGSAETSEDSDIVEAKTPMQDAKVLEIDVPLPVTTSPLRRVLTGVAKLFSGWSTSNKQNISLVVQQQEEAALESEFTAAEQYAEMQERIDRYRGWF